MKILLTGASGFLGNIFLTQWNKEHEVTTLGRHDSSYVKCDLSKSVPVLKSFDIVVHAAGKAHVIPKSALEENEFYKVNVDGTQNLLKALQTTHPLPKTLVFISTVAVYGKDQGQLIDENTPLEPSTAYGKSKTAAEQLVLQWGQQYGVNTVILRLPLIIGPNPPGNLGAMIRAIRKGYYFRIGPGSAKRSVVRAIDIARFIPTLDNVSGIFNLTDGYHPSIMEIDSLIGTSLSRKVRVIPMNVAKLLARCGDHFSLFPLNSNKLEKLTFSLTFSDQLARKKLNWNPFIFSADWSS